MFAILALFRKIFHHLHCHVTDYDIEALDSIANPVQGSSNSLSHQRSGQLNQFVNVLSESTKSTILSL